MSHDPVNEAAIAASRLPDLPTAGYASHKQRELTDAIMFLIRGLERDRRLLLDVVIHGRVTWRKRFKQAYRAIHADDEFADSVFGYLVLLAGPNPEAQKARLDQQAKHQQEASWDHRLRTALRQSKDTRELEAAIRRDEAKALTRPVRIFMKS